ncbi:MAG: PEP-CTERM sorting domain-containing protein [Candidatus Omnitrophica bacterium]|nr:PEP-CTERM sorting domain-containing protein [Candidatus Omnitrophota bacterium]
MRKIILAMAILSVGLMMASSQAFAFALVDPVSGEQFFGDVQIKYNDYDFGTVYNFNAGTGQYDPINSPGGNSLTPGVTNLAVDGVSDSWGIAGVTSILKDPGVSNPAFDTLWTPSTTESLEIVFYGLNDIRISADGKTLHSNAQSDAYFRVYLDTTPDMNPTTGMGGFPNNVGNAGDVLLLDCRWVTGVSSTVPEAVYEQALAAAGANPPFGSGEGYLEVVGGTLMDMFDSNKFLGGSADLFLKSSFVPDTSGQWTVLSHDPMSARTTPEPATMIGLSMGLAGWCMSRRKKLSFKR